MLLLFVCRLMLLLLRLIVIATAFATATAVCATAAATVIATAFPSTTDFLLLPTPLPLGHLQRSTCALYPLMKTPTGQWEFYLEAATTKKHAKGYQVMLSLFWTQSGRT